MKAKKPVQGEWKPPGLREVWHQLIKLQEKLNDHSKQIYLLERPPDRQTAASETADTAERVVSNQLAAGVLAAKESSMDKVRKNVCQIHGHQIGQLVKELPTVIQGISSKETTVLCLHCGMTLEEIRAGK